MPELPEVETVKEALKKHLLGRKIISTEIIYQKMIKTPIDVFLDSLKSTIIKDIKRKGKFIIFVLDNEKVLISHLRMEGKYLYHQENEPNTKHTRIVFHLDNNEKVLYDDSRCFGIMELHPLSELDVIPCLSKLGPEPNDCNAEYLFKKLQNSNCEIKSSLLDQSIISGLGNIYVDETLFSSKISPFISSNQITIEQCEKIIINARRILNKAIELGGSTVSSYHPENGVDGKFQNFLSAYGRKNLPCVNCGHKMRKDFIKGRGTSYCPNCQKVSKRVGIYGKIASGKSTISSYFKTLGYPVFSSDECVNNLYTSSLEFKKFLITYFGETILNDNGTISKNTIKNIISNDPSKKKRLEEVIHPLVKKSIEEFIKHNRNCKIIFLEIPLLFESQCDKYVDFIIGVDVSIETQINHLKKRGSKNPMLDLKLNNTNRFEKNLNKCDYIIKNDSSLNELYNRCDEIINEILNS